jgi:purine-binding chemotaxis protein CheW
MTARKKRKGSASLTTPAEQETPPQAPPEPLPADLSDLPKARVASFTPRELAAVLNEPRRTPAYGMAAIPGAPATPAALASTLSASATPVVDAAPAQTEVLLFRLGGERFAAPIASIDEAVDLGDVYPIPESPPQLLGFFPVRGRLVPLYSAADALHVRERSAQHPSAFLLSCDGTRLAIAVDALDDALSLPADAVRQAPASDENLGDGVLLGVANVPDGVVTLVSPDALARACLGYGGADAGETPETPEVAA